MARTVYKLLILISLIFIFVRYFFEYLDFIKDSKRGLYVGKLITMSKRTLSQYFLWKIYDDI